jgi:glycosyltransferase involved in cell wall biosynthesis
MKGSKEAFLFVIPDTQLFQSGGNLYNRQLLDALTRKGVLIREATVEQWPEVKDEHAWSAIFWDSLYLEHPSFAEAAARHTIYMMIHHLESLFPPAGTTADQVFQQKEHPVLQHCEGFLVTSAFTRRYLTAHFPRAHFLQVEPALAAPPPRYPKTSDGLRALLAGNLIARKGIRPFLELLVKDPIPNLQIRIAGSPTHEPAYANQCLTLADQLPNVQFLGELPYSEMTTQYRWANLFISVSKMETFGIALQEAVAHGVPVLTLDRGHAGAHVIAGKNGRAVASLEDLHHQLSALATQQALRASWLAQAALVSIWDHYSWPIAAERFVEQFY